jgi:hypothetical protein
MSYYAAISGNFLPTFRYNLSVQLIGTTYRSHLQGMTHEDRIDRVPLKSVKLPLLAV